MATCPGSRISVLPISINRPPPASSANEASTISPRQRPPTPHPHPAPRSPQELVLELQIPRGRDMRLIQTQPRKHPPLARMRRREHLRPQMPRQLHRRHPHPARRRMNQHPLPPHAAPPGPPARNTRSRTPPAPTPPARTTSHPEPAPAARLSHRHRTERIRNQPHHPIPDLETSDPRTDLQHHPRTLDPHRRLPRIRSSATNTSRKFNPAARTATRT